MRFLSSLLLAGTALAVVACGSGNSSGSAAASGKQAAGLAFAQCMRSHGVPSFPDPGGDGRGGIEIQISSRAGSGSSLTVNGVRVSSPAFRSAMSTCRSKLPNGGHPTAAQAAHMRQVALAFSRCMRAHGVSNFPDPQFQGGGRVRMGFGPGSGIDPSSPVFQAAQKACGKAFGAAGGPVTAKVP